MSNKFYYRNIFVKHDNVSLSDISEDYPSLEMYDLRGIGEPPKTLDTIDISSISFYLQPEVSNCTTSPLKITSDSPATILYLEVPELLMSLPSFPTGLKPNGASLLAMIFSSQ